MQVYACCPIAQSLAHLCVSSDGSTLQHVQPDDSNDDDDDDDDDGNERASGSATVPAGLLTSRGHPQFALAGAGHLRR